MISSKKFTFDFLKVAEKFWFPIFCTHNTTQQKNFYVEVGMFSG